MTSPETSQDHNLSVCFFFVVVVVFNPSKRVNVQFIILIVITLMAVINCPLVTFRSEQ